MAPPIGDHTGDRQHWAGQLLLGLLIGILLYLFAPAISGHRVLVFRDAAYWHLNTLHWTTHQFQAGRIPLWNDLQGLGTNWVAQGTTSVFYPGTWLLACEVGHFRQRYAVVMVLHFMAAGYGMWRLARGLQVGSVAATLAAVSYTLSGPVLVQHANWPFLVSATWLPWALWGLWRSLVDGCQTGGLVAAAGLALMILGGEPQAVGCWLLAAIALVGVGPRSPRSGAASVWDKWPGARPRGLTTCLRVLGILGLGLAASGVQWWPTWEAAASSTRSLHEQPQNLYQALALWADPAGPVADHGVMGALLAPPAANSQADQALQFSQPPWHWGTLVVGNFWGTWSTVHARWDRHLSANDRVWNPTLYAGAATAVLALSLLGGGGWHCFRRLRLGRQGRRRLEQIRLAFARTNAEESGRQTRRRHSVRWLVTLLVVFGLGSCGWYGLVWLGVELQHIGGGAVRTPTWGPQVGGLYWLLSISLPGFDQFRYPAKLWLLAGLAWSLLAAIELDQVLSAGGTNSGRRIRAVRRLGLTATVVLIGLTSGLAILVSPLFVDLFYRQFQSVGPDPWLGMLQLPQALLETHLAVVHSLVVVGALLGWLWLVRRRATGIGCSRATPQVAVWLGLGVGLLTLADLGLSNGWLIQTVDQRVLRDRTIWETDSSPYRQSIPETRSLAQRRFLYDPQLMQQHRWEQMQQKWGPYWGVQPSEKLVWQAIYSMRATGTPQFHLPLGVPLLNTEQTLEPRDATLLRLAAAELAQDQATTATGASLWQSYLRSQGVRYWLTGGGEPAEASVGFGGLQWQTLPRTPPAVWLAEEWSVIPRPNSHRPSLLTADLLRVWFDGQQFLDCPSQVVVDQAPQPPPPSTSARGGEGQELGLVDWRFDATEKAAQVRLSRPAILVWRQTHDPGWWCVLTDDQGTRQWQPTLPVQRYLTGVALPAGQFDVELVYCPPWFLIGGPLSVLSWCCLIVVLVRRAATRR